MKEENEDYNAEEITDDGIDRYNEYIENVGLDLKRRKQWITQINIR